MNKKFRHIVIFKVFDTANAGKVAEIVRQLANATPNLLENRVEISLDTRRGKFVVENFLFLSESDFIAFKASKVHGETVALLKEICEWQVVDYFE